MKNKLNKFKLYMSNNENDEYEENVKQIVEDLIYHTIKNQPKNIVSN